MLWVCKDHPTVKKVYPNWGYSERFWCTLIWPLTSAYFLFAVIRKRATVFFTFDPFATDFHCLAANFLTTVAGTFSFALRLA